MGVFRLGPIWLTFNPSRGIRTDLRNFSKIALL